MAPTAVLLQNQQCTASSSGYLPQCKFSLLERKNKRSLLGKAPSCASWGADPPVPHRPRAGGWSSPALHQPTGFSLRCCPRFCPFFIFFLLPAAALMCTQTPLRCHGSFLSFTSRVTLWYGPCGSLLPLPGVFSLESRASLVRG